MCIPEKCSPYLHIWLPGLSIKHTAGFICLQVVRPHAPLIKFPNRQDIAKPNGEYALYMTLVRVYLITYFSLFVKLFLL